MLTQQLPGLEWGGGLDVARGGGLDVRGPACLAWPPVPLLGAPYPGRPQTAGVLCGPRAAQEVRELDCRAVSGP